MSNRFFPHLLTVVTAFLALAAIQPELQAAPAKPAQKAPPATYKGAIVINARDGSVLFEDNADAVTPPASVTKLMTFLIVHDAIKAGQISTDTPVIVTAEDSGIGGTQVWLKEKEVFPVEDLLYALMIQSANDCANALARTAAGSRAAFVERMNARARELGMNNTTFVTPHGLPPPSRRISEGDLTTPRDLAILARHLIANTDIIKYTSARTRNFGEGRRAQPVAMVNHNKLLGKVPGVDGLKTGFTNGAGFCLAATAERNGNRVIVVTMGTPSRLARDAKIAELIESAFARLRVQPPSPISPVSPIFPASTTPAPTPADSIAAPAQSDGEIPQIVFPAPASRKR